MLERKCKRGCLHLYESKKVSSSFRDTKRRKRLLKRKDVSIRVIMMDLARKIPFDVESMIEEVTSGIVGE